MSRRALLMLTALLLLALALPASAAERSGLAFTVNCTGFTSLGGTLVLDRDNTGAGRESFHIMAKDGNGTAIFSGPVESFYVGSTLNFPIGLETDFATAPTANPIVVSLISAAGNGLVEQIVYAAAGRCSSLPTVEAEDVEVTGVTSPSVPLNILPPGGENTDDLIDAQQGYGIVDTAFLNLRSGDGPEYTIVGRVDGGTKLLVLGRNDDLSWWYVKAGDIVGWAISDFVIGRGDLTNAPVVIPAGEIALPRLFLYDEANLRATASASSEILCEIEGNLEYEIVGRVGDLSWVKLNAICGATPVQGWLPVDLGAVRNPGQLIIPVVD